MTINFAPNGAFGYEGADEDNILYALRMDPDDSFNFDSQSLPSSCPSTTGSFSSTSSLYGPYTPTSRTPTPQQYINFDGSFEHGSPMMPVGFTPPPSATSGFFPLDLKQTVAPTMLTQHGMPSTPSRCNNVFDNTVASHGGLDFTPARNMELYTFVDEGLGSSPFVDSSSAAPPFDSSPPNFDLASTCTWGQYTDSSPITFSSPSMHFMTPNSSPCTSPYGHNRRRVAMDGPQLRSTMLQLQTMGMMTDEDLMVEDGAEQHFDSTFGHVLQTPSKSRTSKPRSAHARSAASRTQTSNRVSKSGYDVKRGKFRCEVQEEQATRHKCDFPNCTRSFRRAEHLKRHQAVHRPNPEFYVCDFCPKPKKFERSRKDNFIDHLRRHCNNDPGSRTIPHPDAPALYAKYESEKKSKSKKPRESSSGNAAFGQRRVAKNGPAKTDSSKTAPIKTEDAF
ncbi:unnamed protein product [Discula destructiva]